MQKEPDISVLYLYPTPRNAFSYLIFVNSTTSSAGVKIFKLVTKKCELVCFGLVNFLFFFGVKKSGISVFLVSVENGAETGKQQNSF